MHVISVHNLRKTFTIAGEQISILDNVSLEIPQGRIHGLLGPNGAGKTTLVKILTTLIQPTAGRAFVAGFDVQQQPLQVRQLIAVVLQQTAVETLLSVEDNLRIYAHLHGIGRRETTRRMQSVIEEFELSGKLRETVQDLSLGTKRRVQIAKIFMTEAPVIFLDEAATGLDPFMKKRLFARLREETRKGRTVLLTTQVLSEAEELCDSIMILHHGKIIASGAVQELRELSTQIFRVMILFDHADAAIENRFKSLDPLELTIDGPRVDMLFKGDEAKLLETLAAVARALPVCHFEVRGPNLEDVFMGMVNKP
jgi:ABC-2 type transport system ATP-binding protein